MKKEYKAPQLRVVCTRSHQLLMTSTAGVINNGTAGFSASFSEDVVDYAD